MQIQYAIYENGIFINKYAVTAFEARKYCVERARDVLKEHDENALQLVSDEKRRPLWFGEEPDLSGFWMSYGFPGPNESLIKITNYTSSWFKTSYIAEDIFVIKYVNMERVDVLTPKTSPLVEIVKSSVGTISRTRDIGDPHDSLLLSIESFKRNDEDKPIKTVERIETDSELS